MGSLIITAINKLNEADVGGGGKAPRIINFEAETGGEQLNAFDRFDGIEIRGLGRKSDAPGINYVDADGRFQDAFRDAGCGNDDLIQLNPA